MKNSLVNFDRKIVSRVQENQVYKLKRIKNKFWNDLTDNIVKWVHVLSFMMMPTFRILVMYRQHGHSFQTASPLFKTTDFSDTRTHCCLDRWSLVIPHPKGTLDIFRPPTLSPFSRLLETAVVTSKGFVYDWGSVCGVLELGKQPGQRVLLSARLAAPKL